MKQIILDTNFLLIPCQFKVDIFSEIDRLCLFNYHLCVLDKSLEELGSIMEKQGGKGRQAAKLALALIASKSPKIIKTKEGTVDDLLLEEAKKGAIIATQDIELKKRLRQLKSKIITLRQKGYLILG